MDRDQHNDMQTLKSLFCSTYIHTRRHNCFPGKYKVTSGMAKIICPAEAVFETWLRLMTFIRYASHICLPLQNLRILACSNDRLIVVKAQTVYPANNLRKKMLWMLLESPCTRRSKKDTWVFPSPAQRTYHFPLTKRQNIHARNRDHPHDPSSEYTPFVCIAMRFTLQYEIFRSISKARLQETLWKKEKDTAKPFKALQKHEWNLGRAAKKWWTLSKHCQKHEWVLE